MDKEQTYYIGQTVKLLECGFQSKLYILAQVEAEKVAAIALVGGNRWSKPVRVGDVYEITSSEMDTICLGSEFEVIKNG